MTRTAIIAPGRGHLPASTQPKSNVSASTSVAPIDDEADFNAMVGELLEDLRIESEDGESSESSSGESEDDE